LIKKVDKSGDVWCFQRPSARIVSVIVEFIDNDKGYVAWLAEHP
jgi:hypothetical protein